MSYLPLILTFLLPQALSTPAAQNQTATALTMLRTSNPEVQWDAKGAVMADITCDGVKDVVVVGYDAKSIWVALVPGVKARGLAKPIVYHFPIDAGSQSGFCSKPVRLVPSPLDCEGEAGPLPGCKAVKGAYGFGLYDDACDHFEFYWDSERKALRWSRN